MAKNNLFHLPLCLGQYFIRPLNPILSILLLFFLCMNNALADQNQTNKDLLVLKNEIATLIKNGDKNPLQKVLNHRRITTNFTTIQTTTSDEEPRILIFPNERPSDITEDEWQALLQNTIDVSDAENGNARLTLLDLDEDGIRDLIIDSYIGGTGLFSYISVVKGEGGYSKSVSQQTAPPNETIDDRGYLYSINGRGGDQQGIWISINNRTYLAYRNGKYGQDQLVLLRSLEPRAKNMPAIAVNYRYQHTLLKQQPSAQNTASRKIAQLNPKLQASLQKQLNRVSQSTDLSKTSIYGECPVPKGLSKEKKELYTWPWFGPGHYTIDIVADFPVYDATGCHAARLVNIRNSYIDDRSTQPTMLWLQKKPSNLDNTELEIELKSIRIPINVKSTIIDLYSFED